VTPPEGVTCPADLAAAAQALRAAGRVAVVGHVNPEPDCIGSTLGATLVLREAGAQAQPFNADPVPEYLHFLPGAEEIVRAERLPDGVGIILVVDSSDPERVGGLLRRVPSGARVVNVDHHQSNTRFGDVNWVEPQASSAGEMVWRLAGALGARVTPAIAVNLLAAIMGDTGSFRFANASPSSLRAAAALVEAGARPDLVAGSLYGSKRPEELRLLVETLGTMGLSADGAVAWIDVTQAVLARAGMTLDDTEGFIEYPRSLRGVEVALAFKEAGPAVTKVSLRSRGRVDVAALAGGFGGGGHRNAAGFTLAMPLAEARPLVLAAATRVVAQRGAAREPRPAEEMPGAAREPRPAEEMPGAAPEPRPAEEMPGAAAGPGAR
jgi:phosphoesterase RecJ-like protein